MLLAPRDMHQKMHFVNFLGSWGGRLQEFQESETRKKKQDGFGNFSETLYFVQSKKKQDELTVSRAPIQTAKSARGRCARGPQGDGLTASAILGGWAVWQGILWSKRRATREGRRTKDGDFGGSGKARAAAAGEATRDQGEEEGENVSPPFQWADLTDVPIRSDRLLPRRPT